MNTIFICYALCAWQKQILWLSRWFLTFHMRWTVNEKAKNNICYTVVLNLWAHEIILKHLNWVSRIKHWLLECDFSLYFCYTFHVNNSAFHSKGDYHYRHNVRWLQETNEERKDICIIYVQTPHGYRKLCCFKLITCYTKLYRQRLKHDSMLSPRNKFHILYKAVILKY